MHLSRSILVAVAMLIGPAAFAQKADPGTSPISDPARSSASQGLGATTTGESRSGSGSSTSGGRDANGDQGRDAMPDSSIGVRPQKDQPKRPYEGSTSGKQ